MKPALWNLLQVASVHGGYDTVIIREPFACIPLDRNTQLCYNEEGALALDSETFAADVRSAQYGE